MASVAALLEYVEHQTDLDVIAVTDHEDAAGGLRARELAAQCRYRFEVVPGAEITTRQGHVVGLWLERTPRSFRSVEATLEAIHAQGGVAIAPHPLSWLTRSLSMATMDRIQERCEPGVTFDAVELANPSPAGRLTRAKCLEANARWKLPGIGSSDAHHLAHVGCGWTEFDGRSAEGLKRAIQTGSTMPGMTRYPSMREVGIGQTLLGLAWGYTATPRKVFARIGRAER
jgi:predicted metal-dependent phosphoesterase TrpH